MKKDFLKYGNLIAFVAMVVINILATLGAIGGVTTREVSDMYKSLLTPANYAFSIWSVIYLLLAVTVYRQMIKPEISEKTGSLFILSSILNIALLHKKLLYLFLKHFRHLNQMFLQGDRKQTRLHRD